MKNMNISNKTANIYKIGVNKNLSLWDFTKEMNILDSFKKKGSTNMEDDKPLSRKERFKKYRESRLRNAVNAIRLCENMANKGSYEYADEDARTIVKHLQEAVSSVKHAFASADKKNKEKKYF
tara:strand:- start:310 stop:678 length:369 start_codon:yes stop_codon:yes gene_type:complete